MLFLYFYLVAICLAAPCQAAFESHLRKIESKMQPLEQVKNIDCIYLINLDHRPGKLHHCMAQFSRYGIRPERLPAIYGWNLTQAALDEVGVILTPKMELVYPILTSAVMMRTSKESCEVVPMPLKELYGQTIFSQWLSLGAIGCTLSHLSAIFDGYDSGYRAIWVIEDDIQVESSPHQLSGLIEKLDALVGKEGWDILYTDPYHDTRVPCGSASLVLPYMWRPDIPLDHSVYESLLVGDDFIKIGNRIGAHSLIISRSGMKKLVEFYTTHHLYAPYDHELAIIPGIRLFVTKKSIVTVKPGFSDTKHWRPIEF